MKTIKFWISFFLLLGIENLLFSQSYNLDSGNVFTINLGFNQLGYGGLNFTNNSNKSLDLKYTKIDEDTVPGSWFDLCVNANCYIGIPDTGSFYVFPVLANQKGFLKCHFWTGTNAGTSKARIYIYEPSLPNNGDTLVFVLNINTINGFKDNVQESSISIYPSPASQFIFFNMADQNGKVNSDVKIINAKGQIVFSEKLTTNKINVSAFSNGIYIIQIKNEINKTMQSKKLIINH